MKTEAKVTKDGTPMTTKDGEPMFKNTLESGDVFVCLWNKPIEEQKGNAKYPRYVMKANVLIEGKEVEKYIDLTPSQFKSLCNVADDPNSDDLNQYKFKAYTYENSQGSTSVGITHKEKKEPVRLTE